jgi:hypothetical protein
MGREGVGETEISENIEIDILCKYNVAMMILAIS